MKLPISSIFTSAMLSILMMAGGSPSNAQELERIISEKRVRVAAIEAWPYYRKDLASGEWTGMLPDMLKLIFGSVGVKLEWVETTYGAAPAGLQANHFDVVGGFNATPARALAVGFTIPVLHSRLAVYTLASDGSAYSEWSKLNSPKVRIAAVDGAATTVLAQSFLPDAQWTLVKSTDAMILELESKRADVILSNEPTMSQYHQAKGTGTLVIPEPIRAQPGNLGLRKNATDLKAWLDITIAYYTTTGQLPTIWEKYVPRT
jgi:polar amino acid transport system substrate-binding protein